MPAGFGVTTDDDHLRVGLRQHHIGEGHADRAAARDQIVGLHLAQCRLAHGHLRLTLQRRSRATQRNRPRPRPSTALYGNYNGRAGSPSRLKPAASKSNKRQRQLWAVTHVLGQPSVDWELDRLATRWKQRSTASAGQLRHTTARNFNGPYFRACLDAIYGEGFASSSAAALGNAPPRLRPHRRRKRNSLFVRKRRFSIRAARKTFEADRRNSIIAARTA